LGGHGGKLLVLLQRLQLMQQQILELLAAPVRSSGGSAISQEQLQQLTAKASAELLHLLLHQQQPRPLASGGRQQQQQQQQQEAKPALPGGSVGSGQLHTLLSGQQDLQQALLTVNPRHNRSPPQHCPAPQQAAAGHVGSCADAAAAGNQHLQALLARASRIQQ
jgi:hypothetical protein